MFCWFSARSQNSQQIFVDISQCITLENGGDDGMGSNNVNLTAIDEAIASVLQPKQISRKQIRIRNRNARFSHIFHSPCQPMILITTANRMNRRNSLVKWTKFPGIFSMESRSCM